MSGETILVIDELNLVLGEFSLKDIGLDILEDEYHVLLGPTGGGKTVLLECIVGFLNPDSGRILISGVDVVNRLPEERNVGYVPQDFSLFPSMTVRENLSFGPRMRAWEPARITAVVDDLIELLDISHIQNRLPLYLSGGEKQRVSIGRALAVRPDVLILDEPLSALDESRRSELAIELKRIQRSVGATFLHVCHNLDEASEVADRITIISEGSIVQTGTVSEILYRPINPFVARFTGTKNVFPVSRIQNDKITLEDESVLEVAATRSSAAFVAVRPEAIEVLSCSTSAKGNNLVSGRVIASTGRALMHELVLRASDERLPWCALVARKEWITPPSIGDELTFSIPPGAVWLIPDRFP